MSEDKKPPSIFSFITRKDSPLPPKKPKSSQPQTPIISSAAPSSLSFASPTSPAKSTFPKDKSITTTSEIESSFQTTCLSSEIPLDKKIPSFLETPLDALLRPPSDPLYDKSTLHIPPHDFKRLTEAQKQYFSIKQTHFDSVIFFKVGKFYEIYDYDAIICNRVLGLSFMNGERLHTGFPEVVFESNCEKLVMAGYSVGRVEQMETPAEMKERKKKTVHRELCEVITSYNNNSDSDSAEKGEDNLMFIIMEIMEEVKIIIVSLATVNFRLGSFRANKEELKSLVLYHRPVEICYSKRYLGREIKALFDEIISELNFKLILHDIPSSITIDKAKLDISVRLPNSNINCEFDGLLNLSLNYFEYLKIDPSLFDLLRVDTIDSISYGNIKEEYMLISPSSVESLDLVKQRPLNSLYSNLDLCLTLPGKRLLRKWILKPLLSPKEILFRQRSSAMLEEDNALFSEVHGSLKRLPDFERLLVRLYYKSSNSLEKEAVSYSSRKAAQTVDLFIKVFKAFKRIISLLRHISSLKESNNNYNYGDNIFEKINGFSRENVEGMEDFMQKFSDRINFADLKESGCIAPVPGLNEDFDRCELDLAEVRGRLEDYLLEVRARLGVAVKYYSPLSDGASLGRVNNNARHEQFQLEVSHFEGVPDDFELMTSRKDVRRYHTPFIREQLQRLNDLCDRRAGIVKGITLEIFRAFCGEYEVWRRASSLMAELDVLAAFVSFKRNSLFPMSHPSIIPSSTDNSKGEKEGELVVEGNWNPLIAGEGFVRNDIALSHTSGKFMLLTGPNMGGKSTVLRQACLTVVMAQMGAYVPASRMRLSPVDRLFTRIGAADLLVAGKSTFRVELEETLAILERSTGRSLVVLDELGRGTSTADGTAIAYGVAKFLLERVDCRCFFSTHYHRLVSDLLLERGKMKIQEKTMGFEVGEDGEDGVRFLYVIKDGVSYKSYAVNVARMAQIPGEILREAEGKIRSLERGEGRG